MNIRVTFRDTEPRRHARRHLAGRDFASLLPLILTVTDFHDTEKTSDLPRQLSTIEDHVRVGTPGSAGDITLYASWATSHSSTATSPTPTPRPARQPRPGWASGEARVGPRLVPRLMSRCDAGARARR